MDPLSFCLDASLAAVQYLFIVRLMERRPSARSAVLYALLWTLCALTSEVFSPAGISALLQVLLMYVTAHIILHASNALSWLGALLTVCITELAVGTVSSLQILLLPQLFGSASFEPVRTLTAAATVVLAAIVCFYAGRFFPSPAMERLQAILLLIPLLFFCCAEAFLLQVLYAEVPDAVTIKQHLHLGVFLIQLLGFATLFCTLWACRQVQNAWKNRLAAEALAQAAQAQRVYVEEARRRYAQTKSIRHDLRNHLLVLDGLLNAGHLQEARSYLKKLDTTAQTAALSSWTGNPVVDTLISEKICQAEEDGITVTIEGRLPEGPDDFDLCILFANAMDNAIHASRKVSQNREVRIQCICQGDLLLLRFRNPCMPGAAACAGTGLRNMQAAAEKYHGTLRTIQEGGLYLLEVLLHISAHSEDS